MTGVHTCFKSGESTLVFPGSGGQGRGRGSRSRCPAGLEGRYSWMRTSTRQGVPCWLQLATPSQIIPSGPPQLYSLPSTSLWCHRAGFQGQKGGVCPLGVWTPLCCSRRTPAERTEELSSPLPKAAPTVVSTGPEPPGDAGAPSPNGTASSFMNGLRGAPGKSPFGVMHPSHVLRGPPPLSSGRDPKDQQERPPGRVPPPHPHPSGCGGPSPPTTPGGSGASLGGTAGFCARPALRDQRPLGPGRD